MSYTLKPTQSPCYLLALKQLRLWLGLVVFNRRLMLILLCIHQLLADIWLIEMDQSGWTPNFGRMFGSAPCDYSATLRQKFGVSFAVFCVCRSRLLEVTAATLTNTTTVNDCQTTRNQKWLCSSQSTHWLRDLSRLSV